MDRAELKADDFSYDLPDDRIAKYPLKDRNQSKLLVYKGGELSNDRFANLESYLPANSTLVFNDSKVLSARLKFKKATGAQIEVFCLEPYESTIEQALTSTASCKWQCMVGNLKRFKEKDVLEMNIAGTVLQCRLVKKLDKEVVVQFDWLGGIPFSDILNEAGEVPLPPYLNREAEEADRTSYQTVYAKIEGAVAAPTAGLHFVDSQLEKLQKTGHDLAYVTLYVGAGTFRQVKSERLVEHDMHSERIQISKSTLEQLLNTKGKIIAVGTTSLRTLESLYWYAARLRDQSPESRVQTIGFELSQDDAYELNDEMSREEALQFLIDHLNETGTTHLDFHTALFIMPSYKWKVIDGLITNFHQPHSTLLSLVAAWIGEDWKRVYDYALENDFRFLSYGDSSILLRE
ncbi:MAG: S-adenosylmethionine tRNA ribosyltransferase [Flavobacteriales bacterium]|nr:S-adenosylmethionine tRNA ribosyltransferase [Flavobacteriales bacterium]